MDIRSERRAALKATHPDLGGDADAFIAVMRAFDRTQPAPMTAAAPGGSGAAAPRPRPTITTTPRSRAARSVRRARRRLRTYSDGRLGGHRYAHLLEERP